MYAFWGTPSCECLDGEKKICHLQAAGGIPIQKRPRKRVKIIVKLQFGKQKAAKEKN